MSRTTSMNAIAVVLIVAALSEPALGGSVVSITLQPLHYTLPVLIAALSTEQDTV